MRQCRVCALKLPESSFRVSGNKWRSRVCVSCRSKRATACTIKNRKVEFSRAWFRRRFSRLQNNAKKRGKEFGLTFEEFCRIRTYKDEICFYCKTISGVFSIERVDNQKGYRASNCVVACYRCNKIKSKDFTAEEMKILGAALRKIDQSRNYQQ